MPALLPFLPLIQAFGEFLAPILKPIIMEVLKEVFGADTASVGHGNDDIQRQLAAYGLLGTSNRQD